MLHFIPFTKSVTKYYTTLSSMGLGHMLHSGPYTWAILVNGFGNPGLDNDREPWKWEQLTIRRMTK